jgi:PAS domain S-box-containing protein
MPYFMPSEYGVLSMFSNEGGTLMETSSREWLYQQIVEGSQDAIVFADTEGIIRLWNSGAEAIFGYSAEEAIGETLDLIVPEKLREKHWEGYRKVMATGVTKYGSDVLAVPAIKRDSSRLSVEFTIVLLQDDTGKPIGTAAIMRDVTERWQKEKELKKRLAELEEREKKI